MTSENQPENTPGEEPKESALQSVQYDQEFLGKLVDAKDKLESIASKRSALNAEAQEIFANLDQYGLNRDALRAAVNYLKKDPEKRENYDLSYAISRKALGVPIQEDLFSAKMKAEVMKFQDQKKQEQKQQQEPAAATG